MKLATSMQNGFGQHTLLSLLIIADDEKNVESGVRLGRAKGFKVMHSSIKRLTNG
jgi:hypothetical protein